MWSISWRVTATESDLLSQITDEADDAGLLFEAADIGRGCVEAWFFKKILSTTAVVMRPICLLGRLKV